MEQHPIPQDVTGFQFKLVGDITLKQFAYIAGGIIIAYVIFKTGFLPPILKYPIAIMFFGSGFALAFVPVQQRPLDRWFGAFLKSIYAPTHYVWRKSNPIPDILLGTLPAQVVQAPVAQPGVPAQPHVSQPSILQWFSTLFSHKSTAAPSQRAATPPAPIQQSKPAPVAPHNIAVMQVPVAKTAPHTAPTKPQTVAPQAPQPTGWAIGAPRIPSIANQKMAPTGGTAGPSITGKRLDLDPIPPPPGLGKTAAPTDTKQVEKLNADYEQLEKKLGDQMQALQKALNDGTVTKDRFKDLQLLVAQLMAEKERLSKQLTIAQQKISEDAKSPLVKPVAYTAAEQAAEPTVHVIPQNMAKQAGIPQMTAYPNVITGIIGNPQSEQLPGLIVTVKDREGMPVRALKTNKLGQFAASTPLPDGTYIIEVEDPQKRYIFDRIEITLSNKVLPPLAIMAKGEKELSREKLSREIFGQKTV